MTNPFEVYAEEKMAAPVKRKQKKAEEREVKKAQKMMGPSPLEKKQREQAPQRRRASGPYGGTD